MMAKAHVGLCCVYLIVLPIGYTASSPCDSDIAQWLANLDIGQNEENATITVPYSQLRETLKEQHCDAKHLSLELWRVETSSAQQRPKDFGTNAYTCKF